ncbi:hypothetical protein [Flavobacterium sp. MK4S-17]|uniref:hypothetical protein n=1 Tax=Flavobacterium sp. MK4S-17 TaxID=2543737 RepID=UPI00135C9E6A|nr:hypothetical protein [Flavobacterium sp. MK4S-17]
MKKFSYLMLLLLGVFLSCDANQEEAPTNELTVAEVRKTDPMLDFEKSIVDFGKMQNSKKDEAMAKLVTDARNYLTYNGKSIAEGLSDYEIINQALDVHLAKINELRTN